MFRGLRGEFKELVTSLVSKAKTTNMNNPLVKINKTIWHKYRSFWWPKLVSITCFALYRRNPSAYLSHLLTRDYKITKINSYHNWIWKILRYQNCIICEIFKVWGSKCTYFKTYYLSPIFAIFFIIVSLLSTTPFLKKSKSIGLQLRPNSWKKEAWEPN